MVLYKPNPVLFALVSCLTCAVFSTNVHAQRHQSEAAAFRLAVLRVCFDAGRDMSACIPSQALSYQGLQARAATLVGARNNYQEAPVGRNMFASSRPLKRSSCGSAVSTGDQRPNVLRLFLGGAAHDTFFKDNNFVVDMAADGAVIHVGYRDCWY